MTTIVYDHKNKQIACDGRILKSYTIMSESYQKWRQVGDDFYFFSGTVADIKEFIKHPQEFGAKPPCPIDVSAIRVSNGKAYECGIDEETGYYEIESTYSASMGSGAEFALAALDHGKSAKEAVEYAMTRDAGTGGKVHVFDVEAMEFLDG